MPITVPPSARFRLDSLPERGVSRLCLSLAWSGFSKCLLLLFSHSVMSDSLRPHGLQYARLPSPSLSLSQSLLRLMSIELMMPSNHPILCHPLLLLPSVFPSIRVFSNMGNIQYSPAVFWSSLEPFASVRTREAAQGPGMKQMVPSWGVWKRV